MKTIKVLDHGYVKYLDHMGDDGTIAMDARTSYDKRSPGKNRALLRRLMRDQHTSPFEMGVIKVEMKMPIFVARQIVRHRTASMNEVSARYTESSFEMYMPEEFAKQSKYNKQGRASSFLKRWTNHFKTIVNNTYETSYDVYQYLLSKDVTREQARTVLPLATYTKFVWKVDLHNLMHFLQLRLDNNAQYECRVYADALWEMVQELFPICAEAFEDYRLHGVNLSRFERDILIFLLGGLGSMSDKVTKMKFSYVDGGHMTETEWENFVTKFSL